MPTYAAIPEEKRSPSLKTLLRRYVDLIARISAANPELARQHQHLFYFFAYAWLADAGGDAEVEADLTRRREEYARLGFDGTRVKDELGQVLDEDQHLGECCSTLLNLAYFLDIEFISYAASHQNESGISDEEYGNVFKGFSDYVYAEPFRTLALSHLYNFEAEDNDLLFDVVRVVRLNTSDISLILGEPTNQSFLHPLGGGDYFIDSIGQAKFIVAQSPNTSVTRSARSSSVIAASTSMAGTPRRAVSSRRMSVNIRSRSSRLRKALSGSVVLARNPDADPPRRPTTA
jgi:hypothetical protein